MADPTVSVLILTYARPQLISRAIESVVAQSLSDWELLVVHDGPDEETAVIMEEWEKRDARIRYFRRRQPGNIAEATNFGIKQARGTYIAILDDDDYWSTPEKLAKQSQFLESHPEYSGCGGGVIVIDEAGRERLRYMKPERYDDVRRVALLANPVAHSTSMYRRSAAHQVGLYDESLAGFQDWDFFLKLCQAGRFCNLPEYLTYYQLWEGGGSFHSQKKNTRSALRIVWKQRRAYPGFPLAMGMAMMYHAYAHLPVAVKRASYGTLSRLKKSLSSRRPSTAQA